MAHFREARVFVSCRFAFRGHTNALLEALSCKVPTIVRTAPLGRSNLRDPEETGLVGPTDDVDALSHRTVWRRMANGVGRDQATMADALSSACRSSPSDRGHFAIWRDFLAMPEVVGWGFRRVERPPLT